MKENGTITSNWLRTNRKGLEKILYASRSKDDYLTRVKELVKGEAITVDIATPAVTIAKIMAEKDIGSVVVTHEDKIVGIITERDFVRKVLASGNNPAEITAGTCMSAPLISIDPDALLSEAAKIMSSNKVRRLAVIKEGKLHGMLTSSDIARHLAGLASHNDPYLNAMARKTPPKGLYS